MNTHNPVIVDGKSYNKLGLALVISPLVKGDQLSASVVMKLTPMRVNEEGVYEQLTEPEHQKTLVVSDAFAQTDPAFVTALQEIRTAVQKYVDTKNL